MSFSLNQFREQVGRRGGFARSHVFTCNIVGNPLFKDFEKNKDFLFCKAVTLPSFTVNTEELKFFTRPVKFPGARTFEPLRLTFFNTNDFIVRHLFEKWNNTLNAFASNARGLRDSRTGTTAITEKTKVANESYNFESGRLRNELLYGSIILTHFSIEAEVAGLGGLIRSGRNSLLKNLPQNQFLSNIINAGAEIAQGAATQILNQTDAGRIAQGIARRLGKDLTPNIRVAVYVMENAFPTNISGLQYSYDNDGEMQTYDVEFQFNHMNYVTLTEDPLEAFVTTSEDIILPT